uniref:FA complementation group B n=1 Tax=Tetraodon nigroviridis TaxID=99883 RepID=H3D8X2_TETNG
KALVTNHHLLCFSGNIFLLKCHQTTDSNDSKAGDLTLAFCRLSYNREENAFVKAAEGAVVLGAGASSRTDILKCKCVYHCRKRVETPCILVLKKGDREDDFQYSLFTLSSDRLELCLQFRLPYRTRKSVRVLRGPAVMWRHAGGVFFTSLQTGAVKSVPVQVPHAVFGELPFRKDSTQSVSPNLGYFIENGRTFDGNVILPHPYISITQCMLILSAEKSDCSQVLQSAVVAATSEQQLVYFENGMVKNACKLPFEQPNNIQIIDAGRGGSMFVVSFQQGHACSIWKETFQVAAQWSDVDSVHVGDFLACGTEQILVVFGDHAVAGKLEKFLLTDLCGITYASCQIDAPQTAPPPESHFLTLQALESRLQNGLSYLQELQREAREKQRVLQRSVQALTDVLSDREPSLAQPEQEGLTALWDCDQESKENALIDKTAVAPAASSKPRVDRLWHRIIQDRMVVGAVLTTDSSVPVANVSLSIVTEVDQSAAPAVIQSQSQAFWLPADCASMFLEPAAKRSKQQDDLRVAVTAVTRLTPLLNSACVKCSVMLHYIQKQDAFALVSGSVPHTLHCGEVALDIKGDFQSRLLQSPQLKTDEVQEDLLSLMTVLDHWVFLIDSPDYSLGDVEGWIQKRFNCKKMELSHQYFYLESSEPSASLLLRWCQKTTFQGELSVHSSSQVKMFQFLNSFLTFLPISCNIHPVKGAQGQLANQSFSLVLEKEVRSLADSLSSLLCDEDREDDKKSPGHETPETGPVTELQGWRDLWQLDVEKSRKRLHPLVDVGRYRSLMQRVYDVQQNVDLVALLDSKRTFLSWII